MPTSNFRGSQIYDLVMHLKDLEKQKQTSNYRWVGLLKTRVEINEIIYKESMKQKIWLFEKINSIEIS